MVTRVPIYLGGTGESTQASAQAALGLHTSNSVAFAIVFSSSVNLLANDGVTLATARGNDHATLLSAQSNDGATLATALGNDYSTYLAALSNDYATYLNAQANDGATLLTARGNDYSTYLAALSNDYATYLNAQSNDGTTLATARGNDYSTYLAALSNDYATYLNAQSNDGTTLATARANDFATYTAATNNVDIQGTFSDAKANIVAQTLTDAATIAWDTSLGRIATVTLGGNRLLAAPSNVKVGTYILNVIQDATGNRALTFNVAFKFTAAVAPTLTTTANARDVFSFISDGTNLYGAMIPDVR